MQHDSLAESQRLLRSSYRLDPNSYETNYLLGLLSRRQGRFDESNRFLQQAREIRRRAAASASASASETTTGGPKSTFPDQAAAKKP